MTERDAPDGDWAGIVRRRLDDMRGLFAEYLANVSAQVTGAPPDPAGRDVIAAKVSDLKSIHDMLMKAEEAYEDRFGSNRPDEVDGERPDPDELERRLDRLRASLETE